ncbi:MAG: 50S ribosomal protein L11 methyltransferase [Gammaproteobacteria bacterium]
MSWLQLTLECDGTAAEKLSGLLEQFGAISVSLSGAGDEMLLEEGILATDGFWKCTRLSALLHEDTDLDILLVCLRNCAGPDQIHAHQVEVIGDRDWVREVQKAHRPLIFGERLCVCPDWYEPPAHIPHLIMLNPGLAFGTGGHDTTAMCLEWMVQNDIADKIVIDYGCGSGVLALAAAALGANHVYAVDIDPQALLAARENAERNHMQDTVTISLPGAFKLPVADILLANILLGPLLRLAPEFAGLVGGGGALVLSGLLAVQVEDCLAAYQTWFNMQPPLYRREWSLLEGNRHSTVN